MLPERASTEARAAFPRDLLAFTVVEFDADTGELGAAIAEVTGVRTLDALDLVAAQRAGGGALQFPTFDLRQA